MAVTWLLIAVVGLAATEVPHDPGNIFASLPPLPIEGMLLCISNVFH